MAKRSSYRIPKWSGSKARIIKTVSRRSSGGGFKLFSKSVWRKR
jgi:hypothetical protein